MAFPTLAWAACVNGEPFNVYVTLADFRNLHLEDGDRVEFVADTRGKTIMVAASGAIHGRHVSCAQTDEV